MKHLAPLAAACLLGCFAANAEKINISTPSTSLVVDATEGKPLKFL